MNLKTLFLTQNNCYKSGKRHTPKGIMFTAPVPITHGLKGM